MASSGDPGALDLVDETIDGANSTDRHAARWAAVGAALRDFDRVLWATTMESIELFLRRAKTGR